MKNIKYKSGLWVAFSLFVATFALSCTDDVVLPSTVDEGNYDKINAVYGSLHNLSDSRANALMELRTTDITTDFCIELTKAHNAAIDATLQCDETLAANYNAAHKTDFPIFPADLLVLEEQGAVLIAPGDTESIPVTVTFKSCDELTVGQTYLVPLSVVVTTKGLKMDNMNYVLLVKYVGEMADCSKPSGMKVISCMEVNDVNPLNNLEFTLKDSGKLLFDMVVLFSANIRYDEATNRVFLWNNENITALLDHREKYIKPLQDRGIKVLLGVLGDHTKAGVANLSTPVAAQFAAELKSYCDAYNLDGICYDDEYSDYAPAPGLIFPASYDAAARLAYETKMAMPDKLCMVYIYHLTSSFGNTIEGVEPGQFVDYALADYGDNASTGSYKGITKRQLAPYSQEFAKGNITNERLCREIVTNGFGAHMIFSMNPYRTANYNWSIQQAGLQAVAKGFFNEELVWSGVKHPKDWK
ncbi:MAG: DUF1735 domain-containing protein [Alistipes sp.]